MNFLSHSTSCLWRTFAIAVVSGCCLVPSTSIAVQRIALVIGNDSYRNVNGLQNARSDARAMAAALESSGFRVTLRLDANRDEIKQAVRTFKGQVAGGDDVVFYFSGHGVQLGAANYLLPVDIKGESEEQIKDDALPLQRVLDDLQDQKAGFSLAIIDACRNNPFKSAGRRSIGGRGLAPPAPATGQMVLFSAGAGQEALDRLDDSDRSPNGLFTRVLLKQMQQPGMPVDRMLHIVRDDVVRLAKSVGHEQVPALYDQALGEFYFRPTALGAVAYENSATIQAAPQSDDELEQELWYAIRDSKDPQDFGEYLSRHPTGRYAKIADEKLRQLKSNSFQPFKIECDFANTMYTNIKGRATFLGIDKNAIEMIEGQTVTRIVKGETRTLQNPSMDLLKFTVPEVDITNDYLKIENVETFIFSKEPTLTHNASTIIFINRLSGDFSKSIIDDAGGFRSFFAGKCTKASANAF